MKQMLIDIIGAGLALKMADGSKWTVNPWDASICCCWTPTNEMIIEPNTTDSLFPFNITDSSSGQTVRAVRGSLSRKRLQSLLASRNR